MRCLIWSLQSVLFLAIFRAIWSDVTAQLLDSIIASLIAAAKQRMFMNLFGSLSSSTVGGSWLDTWMSSSAVQQQFNSTGPGPVQDTSPKSPLKDYSQDLLHAVTWIAVFACKVLRRV